MPTSAYGKPGQQQNHHQAVNTGQLSAYTGQENPQTIYTVRPQVHGQPGAYNQHTGQDVYGRPGQYQTPVYGRPELQNQGW